MPQHSLASAQINDPSCRSSLHCSHLAFQCPEAVPVSGSPPPGSLPKAPCPGPLSTAQAG